MIPLLKADMRISRFHDEKGHLVDGPAIINAVPAFWSAAAKRLFAYRPQVPMISYRARRVIAGLLSVESQMVEFGAGNSTPWFAERVKHLLSVEDDPAWHDYVNTTLAAKAVTNVTLSLRAASAYADLSNIEDNSLDFVLVDGSDRTGCVLSAAPKIKMGGFLYLDNSDKDMTIPGGDLRLAEQAVIDIVKTRGGDIRYFSDFSPTNFFVEQGLLARL